MADVQHAAVLHVGTGTDAEAVDVAADDGARPYRNMIAERDVADDGRRGVHVDLLTQRGRKVAKGLQGKRLRHDK